MFRKNYFTFLLAAVLFLTGSVAAFAQTGIVRGKVEIKKTDGSVAPVSDAVVEIFKQDQKGKLSTTKTNKKGEFGTVGALFGTKYLIAVSGQGIAPQIFPDVKAGMENILITVTEGDGKQLTEDEAKQALNAAPVADSGGGTTELTEAQKKEQAELEKKNAEIAEQNKKVEASNAVINASIKAGSEAFNAKNYDLAIIKYEEGYNAAPNFAGTATVFLNNMSSALVNRSKASYATLKPDGSNRASVLEMVKKDAEKAVSNSNKALEMLKTVTAKDEKEKKGYEDVKKNAIINRKDAYYMLVKTGADASKADEAITAYKEYLEIETVAETKLKNHITLAEILQESGKYDLAVTEYEKILETNPDNVDALFGAGLNLFILGDSNKDKAKLQEAANYLQKYSELAPDTHKFKQDSVGLLATLKKDQNITPQKGAVKKKS